MIEIEAELLFRPDTDELRYLPEGPIDLGSGRFSWVAIQHGPDATHGSLNVFDAGTGQNRSYPLPGRPGFAHPLSENRFIAGVERQLGIFDLNDGRWEPFPEEVDADVEGTIINDGETFDEGIVFGTKDVNFSEPKAGLYLWRESDRRLIRLRDDQICSNGKVLGRNASGWSLYDIDSPTQTVVEYQLDVTAGAVNSPRTVLDFRNESIFPDGMICLPDGKSLIVAFYNPDDADFGVARQYDVATGALEVTWRLSGSPRVTCPQIVRMDGRERLVLTTADEGMSAEQQSLHPNAGCLFVANLR